MKNTTLSIDSPHSCKYCSTPLEEPPFRETLTKAYGVFQRFREQVKRGDFRAGNCTILFRGTDADCQKIVALIKNKEDSREELMSIRRLVRSNSWPSYYTW
ncbi:MAG: hypothetical protein K940chlam3_00116 [Chlamydiae bacterium]|nr:hypothetical protein [Chlamydiota bacterium]